MNKWNRLGPETIDLPMSIILLQPEKLEDTI